MPFNIDVTSVLVFALSVLATLAVTKLVTSYSEWKLKEGKDMEWLTNFVHATCEIAEMLYVGNGRGKEKLAWVIGVISTECEHYGLDFDEAKVTEIVDQFVRDVLNAGK